MRIPKAVKLMGHNVAVLRSKTLMEDQDAYGVADFQKHTITIQSPRRGINPSLLGQTYCHELVHMILYLMDERKLNDNEKFVDVFGQLLYQALTSAK